MCQKALFIDSPRPFIDFPRPTCSVGSEKQNYYIAGSEANLIIFGVVLEQIKFASVLGSARVLAPVPFRHSFAIFCASAFGSAPVPAPGQLVRHSFAMLCSNFVLFVFSSVLLVVCLLVACFAC